MNAHQDAQEGQQMAVPAAVASVLATHTYALADAGMPGAPPLPVCAECYDDWRGDAATGGCTARLLAREVVALRGRAEWAEESARINLQAVHALTDELGEAGADYDAAAARVALLEGLLREALEGLDALVDDPRDPAIRRLLRRMRAALAAGG